MRSWRGEVIRPRAVLIEELEEAAKGWDHQGKPTLAREAERGAALLREGAVWSVRVGHVLYMVDD